MGQLSVVCLVCVCVRVCLCVCTHACVRVCLCVCRANGMIPHPTPKICHRQKMRGAVRYPELQTETGMSMEYTFLYSQPNIRTHSH